MKAGLVLSNLQYAQGDFSLAISLTVPGGAFACLLGPSGCGKTTLLQLIGGFARPLGGGITLGGREITNMNPHLRRLGIVFQDYALFPHLSVEENIAYGLKARREERPGKDKIRRRVEELLALVELKGHARRRIPSLSGGEQQRVALARALAPRPKLLLLDEPLSALDVQLRASLRRKIRKIQEDLGITTLYITHDQEEALTLSDRLYLMRGGKLLQGGTPEELYEFPNSLFAGRFLGRSNTLKAVVFQAGEREMTFKTAAGNITLPRNEKNLGGGIPHRGEEGYLFFRPEDCRLLRGGGANRLSGILSGLEYYGSLYLGELEIGGEKVRFLLPPGAPKDRGEAVSFELRKEGVRWFPREEP